MKIIKNRTLINVLYVLFILFSVAACKTDDDLGKAPRLFRPTVKGDLLSDGNYIEASWQAVKEANSYRLQISRDTFKTIDRTVEVDSNAVIIEELLWDQLYQIQVKAIAPDTSMNSEYGLIGEVKTPKFPSILEPSTINDVNENSAIMRWRTEGASVTEIKVYTEAEKTLVKSVVLTDIDRTNGYRIVSGLASATSYYLELYSNTTLRGYDTYRTKAPLEGVVIDLREIINRPSVLQDTLLKVPAGSTIILKKGLTYEINTTLALSKTVTIASGSDLLIQEAAIIKMNSNFDFAANSTIDSIKFDNIHLIGASYGGSYVLNGSASASVSKLILENCKAEIFRGLTRLKGGTIDIGTYKINNCLIDSISGYGLLTVDANSCKVENILVQNSSISKAELIIQSKKNSSTSLTIENCTFYRAPQGGSYFVDYDAFSVANGINIKNCIFSIGKSKSDNISPKGVRATATQVNASGNYSLSDFVSGGNDISAQAYGRPSSEVFTDPLNGNFKIADGTFPGRSTAGDPRWRL